MLLTHLLYLTPLFYQDAQRKASWNRRCECARSLMMARLPFSSLFLRKNSSVTQLNLIRVNPFSSRL